jgi:hypothetical protein
VAGKSLQPGAHLAAAFSERGAPLDAASARLVLDTLLRLFELGALVFEDADGPTAYNMGPSKCVRGDESA